MTARDDGGQATVEFALVLPLLAVLLLAVVQVGLVVRDQVLLTHAAREAARAVAVREVPSASPPRPDASNSGPADAASGSGASGPRAAQKGQSAAGILRLARDTARRAAGGTLDDDRLTVTVTEQAGRVTVTLGYRAPTDVPLVGFALGDVRLAAFAQMHREIN